MRLIQFALFVLFAFVLSSCEKESVKLVPLDLLSEGLSLKINAPEGAIVISNDLFIMKDVTVRDSAGYNLQIFETEASSLNASTITDRLVEEIENSAFYDSMITREEDGFIYKKVIDENYINYDFRHVKVRGEKQFVMQAGLTTTYTLDQIEIMYNSVK
ncbi:MAG: hypothetical protein ACJA01_000090 [Saprospiraceae bacterium]|jgi:hypothetical protein